MSRRGQIQMSPGEIQKFVRESKTAILVSNGPHGFPHPMPMWFGCDDDLTIAMTTYSKSQKVLNLRRDPRCAVLFESGEVYQELRGVVLYGKAEIVDDVERVIDALLSANRLHAGDDPEQARAIRDGMRKNASKRVLIRVRPDRIASWDHSKLGGVY
jgi:PPOX class probable F420-dependent enzyme